MFQLSLEGNVALVTGGNGGLGEAIAFALQEAGATIAVTGRDSTKNAAAKGKHRLVLEVDVRQEEAVVESIQRVLGEIGGLDILVNCAGSFMAALSPISPSKAGTLSSART